METKLVLLGTGTPNACPNASGPSTAVIVGDRSYLVDFGPGVVRQAAKAYQKGIDALRPDCLTVAILYSSAYRSHCRLFGPDFYSVGAGAQRAAEGLWTEGNLRDDRLY